ncbi:MAG: hypothetical protein QGH60_13395 [Phycisphaerae bacterium]|nr:hypothetical protein [Phycisphaerae bacterium]
MKRRNCWEFMDCGREPGGKRTGLLGVCPAAIHIESDGINHGQAAGRFCWPVEETLFPANGEEKVKRCHACPFFQEVKRQEGESFVLRI